MNSKLNASDVRRVIGHRGGVFWVRYVRYDGEEVIEARRVTGCLVKSGGIYLVCEDGWIPLQSLRVIEPYREAA